MKSTVKKCIAVLIAALIIALVMEVVIHQTNPPLIHYQFNGPVQSELHTEDLTFKNARLQDGVFSTTSEDPQYYANFAKNGQPRTISSVRISFSNPLAKSEHVQIFYPDELGRYSQYSSRLQHMQEGSTDVVVNIPAGIYPELRIDINQPFRLDSIQTSDTPADIVVLSSETWNIARLFGMFAILFILIFLLVYFNIFTKIKNRLYAAGKYIKGHPRKTGKVIGVTAGIIVVLCILLYVGLKLIHRTPHPLYFVCVAAVGFMISMAILFYKHAGKKPEYFFLLIFLTAAVMIATLTPTTIACMSWDDETHYAKTLELSYFGEDARITDADIAFIERIHPNTFAFADQQAVYGQMEQQYQDGVTYTKPNPGVRVDNVAYLPGAIALFLGRMFSLSFHNILILARIAILVLFAALCFFAIRKIKSGKMILILIALLPTNVYLASNFSYDTWVTGFLMLGLAWFFGELQEPNKKLSIRNWIIMLAAMTISVIPKAVYFPLIALLFFMPKTKFSSGKTYLIYRTSIAIAILAVLAAFILPLLSGGSDITDVRGGSDVNASEQIAYILANPFAYIQTIAEFLPSYLSIGNAQMYITSFAYLGKGLLYEVLLVLLWFVAFTDRNEFDRFTTTVPHKIRTLLLVFITIICVASSMYIAFTPVGSNTINGVQARYIIPVIFPVLFVIGSANMMKIPNRNLYNTAVFTLSAAILFLNIGYDIVGRYLAANL